MVSHRDGEHRNCSWPWQEKDNLPRAWPSGTLRTESDSVHNTPTQRSRGAISNPANRFESLAYENDADGTDDFEPSPVRTEFYRDATQSVFMRNDSPDVPFDVSLNPYRGCEHG